MNKKICRKKTKQQAEMKKIVFHKAKIMKKCMKEL